MVEYSGQKEWMLKVVYLPDLLNDDGSDVDFSCPSSFTLDVVEGADGEIGLAGNLARACGWEEGCKIKCFFTDDGGLELVKIIDHNQPELTD